jgi:hypothetical protein
MKIRYIFYSLLLSATFGLASCSTGEESEGGNTNSSSSKMTIGANLPDPSTRVTESADATNGLLTKWQEGETITVFHKFLKDGTALSAMTPLTFVNSAATSATGTFTYNGMANYSFNTGSQMVAFNSQTYYTPSLNSDNSNFTLTLGDYTTQDGTLSNLYKYDALYGSATPTSTTAANISQMHHLLSCVRFDLSNSIFASQTLKNFKFEGIGTSILPFTGAAYTYDGSNVTDKTAATSASTWLLSGSQTFSSTGTLPLYMMTAPKAVASSSESGILASVQDANGIKYAKYVSTKGITFNKGGFRSANMTLNAPWWYEWDAKTYYSETQYATTTSDSYKNIGNTVSNKCLTCPSKDDVKKILSYGVWFDLNKTWTDCYGQPQKGGFWLKAWNAVIADILAGVTITPVETATSLSSAPSDLSTNWMFLPFSGWYENGVLNKVGSEGKYWTSTYYDSSNAYYLVGTSGGQCFLYYNPSTNGFRLLDSTLTSKDANVTISEFSDDVTLGGSVTF